MIEIDDSGAEVLRLDPQRHARIVGAPGSGKTTLLIESIKKLVGSGVFNFDDLLILTNSRNTASILKNKIETTLDSVISGVLVRTPESYAFATLARVNAEQALPNPRLLTAVAQDEILRQTIESVMPNLIKATGLTQTIIQSRAFRDELRDFERIVNDYSLTLHDFDERAVEKNLPKSLFDKFQKRILQNAELNEFEQESTHLLTNWYSAMQILIRAAEAEPKDSRALSSSELLSKAWQQINEPSLTSQAYVPKLVLIDDAGDLSRGAANLLAALANRGAVIWAFGDPDTATGAFQGQNTRLLQSIENQLMQTGILIEQPRLPEQEVILSRVYRHGDHIRDLVNNITKRIGTQGSGSHRAATATEGAQGSVEFTTVNSESEQIGIIAHRLRAAKFGALEDLDKTVWSKMAVLCRSQEEVDRVRSLLAHYEVPTKSGSGGIVLRDQQLVRDLILVLLFVTSSAEISAEQLSDLLTGQLGKLDSVSLRRLKQDLTLKERRLALAEDRAARKYEEYIFNFLLGDEDQDANNDSVAGFKTKEQQKFDNFAHMVSSGFESHKAGQSTLETLWEIWNASRLSAQLQKDALASGLQRAARANEQLDAVMSLFYVLQRHEEQADPRQVSEVLKDLLTSDLAQDTLADQSLSDAVLITTVQGAIGSEFDLVCIVGPQDGIWPNMRSRGSILQLATLENLLNIGVLLIHDRKSTMHDELRLFAAAVSRARKQVLVVAVQSEEQFPSVFYTLGKNYEVENLPHNRFSLRGFIADMRSRLEADPSNQQAAKTLALLSQNSIAGSCPEEWYGIKEPSCEAPLIDISETSEAVVPVSPSKIEMVEECPLNWAIESLGGGPSELSARLGTLIHKAFETSESGAFDELLAIVDDGWSELEFESGWQESRQKDLSKQMLRGIVDYLKNTASSQRLVLSESFFEVTIDHALLRGVADRIEMRRLDDGTEVPLVVDLKTISTAPSAAAVSEDPQLQAYQAGLLVGKFKSRSEDDQTEYEFADSGGAQLLYVHPKTQNKDKTYRTYDQTPMTPEELQLFKQRVKDAATIMASGNFEANVEHHCQSSRYRVACALHIVPPVSHL